MRKFSLSLRATNVPVLVPCAMRGNHATSLQATSWPDSMRTISPWIASPSAIADPPADDGFLALDRCGPSLVRNRKWSRVAIGRECRGARPDDVVALGAVLRLNGIFERGHSLRRE